MNACVRLAINWMLAVALCLVWMPAFAGDRPRLNIKSMPVGIMSMLGETPYFSYKGGTLLNLKEGVTSGSAWGIDQFAGNHIGTALADRGYSQVRVVTEKNTCQCPDTA